MKRSALSVRAVLVTALLWSGVSSATVAAAQEASAPPAAVTGEGSVAPVSGVQDSKSGWAVISTPTGHRLVRVSSGWLSSRRGGTAPGTVLATGAVGGQEGGELVETPQAPAAFGARGPMLSASPAPVSGEGTTPVGEGEPAVLVAGESPSPEGVRPTLLGEGWSPVAAGEGVTPPSMPVGLLVQPGSGGGIQVSWTDTSTNETGFEVMRQRQAGPNWNRSTTLRVGANVTVLLDTPGNGAYRYRVRAVNGAGASEFTPWGEMQVAGEPPAAPTQALASDLGNGSEVRITWADNSADETGFELARETLVGSGWTGLVTLSASANQTSYTDAVAAGTHRYRVRAINSAGASAFTAWSEVTVAAALPAAPTNIAASDQDNAWHVRVTWTDNSHNETGFDVERQPETSAGAWGRTTTFWLSANASSMMDGVGPGTYRYRVRARNSFGSSQFTPWATATVASASPSTPASPTGVMASDIGNRRAMVSWTDASDNETGFEIERSPSFAGGTVMVGANVVGYIDQSGPGAFSYRIRAVNGAGASAYSAWANVTVAEVAPAAPSGLQAAGTGTAGVTLSWVDNSNNETGFRVERQTQGAGGAWGSVTTLTAPEDATGLSDTPGDGTHRYRVAATNFAGDSPFTAWVTVSLTGGWTVFTPSSDTRIVYVSSSQGNDSNDGLTQATPKRTIAAGYALLRDGYPDWLLLRRGDTWVNQQVGDGTGWWRKSGRSPAERMLVSSYGTSPARPVLKTGASDAIRISSASSFHARHLAFVGLEAMAHHRNPNDPGFVSGSGAPCGFGATANATDLLIEDCKFSHYGTGLVIQSLSSTTMIRDVKIRRCVIVDSYSTSSHSQGIYATRVDGMLIEENVWDHNGWYPQVSAPATIFNRNLYIDQVFNLVCRGNIDCNGASGGMQMRQGGIAEKNLYINNPVSLQMGHAQNPSGSTWTGTIRYNVVLGSRDVAGIPHGWGLGIDRTCVGLEMYENIIAKNVLGTGSLQAIFFNGSATARNLMVRNNIVYKWAYNGSGPALSFGASGLTVQNSTIRDNVFCQATGGHPVASTISLSGISFSGNRYYSTWSPSSWFYVQGSSYNFGGWASLVGESNGSSTQPSFPDPERDVASYMASIGQTASLQAFMGQARQQSKQNWRQEYTAEAVINHVRAGYGLPPAP